MTTLLAPAPESIAWEPQPGPQAWLLSCPVREIFFGGGRGGGKTMGVLGHWLDHQDRYGADAQGVIFRRRYKQLDEVVRMGRRMFAPLGARWYESADKYQWLFPNNALLKLRHLEREAGADEYQGHQYTWICFEEATQWPSPRAIDLLRATLRSAAGVPVWMLLTGNPGGRGHHWVRARYIDPAPAHTPFRGPDGIERVHIRAVLGDNPALKEADPTYVDRLRATGPDWLVRAWLEGDWDVQAGGFLDGVWSAARHVVGSFAIPASWPRWRAMDWGYSRPYSIGWYAIDPDGVVYRYREMYGWGGSPDAGTRETAEEVAAKILHAEQNERKAGIEFRRNPADPSIWQKTGTELSIAEHFQRAGVSWVPALAGPKSRQSGAHEIVSRLKSGSFKTFETCRHFIRTVPVIPADESNLDDVDTEAEDHAWDEARYSLVSRHRGETEPEAPAPGIKPFSWEWLTYEEKKRSPYRL